MEWVRAVCGDAQGARRSPQGAGDVGCLNHDDIAEHLVADHHRWQHQDIGIPGARVPEPMDRQGRGGVGERAVVQQRLVGVGQDHSLGVGVALDFFSELLGLLNPPAHGARREGDATRQAPQAGHARGVASA